MRRLYPLLVGLVIGAWTTISYAAAPIKSWPNISTALSDCQRAKPDPLVCYIEKYPADSPPLSDLRSVRWTSNQDANYGWRTFLDWQNPTLTCAAGGAPDLSKPLNDQCPDPPKGCVYPFEEIGGKCVDPCLKDQGKTVPLTVPAEASPVNVCNGNCEMTVSNADIQKVKGPGGKLFTRGTWVNSGAMGRCDPQKKANDPNPLPDGEKDSLNPPNPGACAAQGKSWIEMNGVTQCISPTTQNPVVTEKTQEKTQTTTTTKPDGTTENKNQVVTTKTTVTDDGDGDPDVTTTTTTTDSNGNKTDQTNQQTKTTFCQENPSVPMCKKSTYVDADCVSGTAPTCDGDAIQCATVSQVRQLRCAFVEKTAASDLGLAVAAGEDPDKATLPTSSNAREVNIQGILEDAADDRIFGAGQCPADLVLTVMGKNAVVPLSKACPYLELFGNVVVAAAMFAAMNIIGKG